MRTITDPGALRAFEQRTGLPVGAVRELELLWDENSPPTNEDAPMIRVRYAGDLETPLWSVAPPELGVATLEGVTAHHRPQTLRIAALSAATEKALNGLVGGVAAVSVANWREV